jgi:hypothetical protein
MSIKLGDEKYALKSVRGPRLGPDRGIEVIKFYFKKQFTIG